MTQAGLLVVVSGFRSFGISLRSHFLPTSRIQGTTTPAWRDAGNHTYRTHALHLRDKPDDSWDQRRIFQQLRGSWTISFRCRSTV